MGEKNPDTLSHKVKLTILLLTIAVCVAITFHVDFIKGIAVVYTHLFYIPILLAGIWYHKKAIYVALGLGTIYILSSYFSSYPFGIDELLRSAAFILVAYVIGLTSEKRAEAEEKVHNTKNFLENLIWCANAPIMVWDPENRISRFNRAFGHLSGYTSDDVTGRELSMLFPEPSREESLSEINRAMSGELWESVEIPIQCKNGETRYILWNLANIYSEDDATLLATIAQGVDITERKRMEEQLRYSLKEKNILLKEIHHRVKNNMQIVSSLLTLQSRYISDKRALELFDDTKGRICSMARVHEKLYRSRSLSEIDFKEYITDFVNELPRIYYRTDGNIKISINAENIYLGIDNAIPCALIINELVTNSLKFAFQSGKGGVVEIDFHRNNNHAYVLTISDDGVGIPEDIDFQNTESLGLQLVNSLTKQLAGSIELDGRNGTSFTVRFGVS